MEKLAIDCGPKTITEPLPREWPGNNWIDGEEKAAVLAALEARSAFQTPLEQVLREYFGCKWAGTTNSGTGSLFASTLALGIGLGTEVLIPGFCWIPTFACVVSRGAIPVLVEVGEDLGIDPADMERKVTARTRAVIVVHMCGAAANMDPIMAVARKHNLLVVEDCAQDNGGKYKGKFVGLFGNIGAFSLQQNKHASTFNGGFMLTDDEQTGLLAGLARDAGLGRIMNVVKYNPGEEVMWGEGRRLNPLAEAMGAVQIKKLPKIIASMRRSQRRIKEGIKDIPGLSFRPLADPASDNGSFLITNWPDGETALRASEALKAEGVPQWTFNLADYGTHMYYHMPMLTQKVGWIRNTRWPWDAPENRGSDYYYGKGALPQSDAIFARGVVMAVPSVLTDDQCDRIVEAYRKVAHYILR